MASLPDCKDGVCAEVIDLKECIARLTALQEEMRDSQRDHEARLREIESKNGQAWEKAVWLVVAAVVGAVLAMALQTVGLA